MTNVALHQQNRKAQPWLLLGMGLTILATVIPFIDRATATVLADHIASGYPSYDSSEIDNAVTAWLAILSVVGIFGLVGWGSTHLALRKGKRSAPWLATGMLVIGIFVAISFLTVRDTSGDVGLAPMLGWLQLLPCLPGVAAVVVLWRETARG